MQSVSHILKMVIIGDDEELITWFRRQIANMKLAWRIRVIEPLRVGSPDITVANYDLVVFLWKPLPLQSLNEVLSRTEPRYRSPEGTLLALGEICSDDDFKKIVVLGRNFTREETVLLAESSVKLVLSLPEKRSKWDDEGILIAARMQKLLDPNTCACDLKEEKIIEEFTGALNGWDKLSDESRMEITDKLLSVLGDSARYYELMARKALKEENIASAEQWLLRAIHKNPNYMQAMTLLADVYFSQKKFDESLALLKKMHMNSPRNVARIARMGECLMAKGDFHKADRLLTDAILIDEYYSDLRDGLGKVKCALGEYDMAKTLLANTKNQRALAVFLNVMGVKLVEEGKFEKAIYHYKKAQFVLPTNEQSHMLFFNIALAYYKSGHNNDAHHFASLAVARFPKYDKATKLLALLNHQVSV